MAVGNYAEISLPIRATATITQNRAINFAGAVPAVGGHGAVAVFGGVSGDLITAVVMGTAQVEAGAAFAADIALQFDSAGRLVTRTTGVTVARSVTAAAAAGDIAEALLIPN
jgi:hypothetical protein